MASLRSTDGCLNFGQGVSLFADALTASKLTTAKTQKRIHYSLSDESLRTRDDLGRVGVMQTDIQIVQISDAVKNAETFVLVGRRDYLLSDAIYHLLPQDVQNYWETMVDACEPGDAGKSTETWRGEAGPKKVSVCVLPEACSRHNSPARPHAITHLLQSTVPANGVSAVILVVEEASHSVAAVAAAARAIPVYSRKTGSQSQRRRVNLCIVADDERPIDIDVLQIHLDAVRMCCRLVDTPASELHTQAFVELARETAATVGAEISVLEGESLAHAGLGGIWGVGKAASHPPALVVLEYAPDGYEKTVGWVGKGIVYDTGGLSIKSKTGMPGGRCSRSFVGFERRFGKRLSSGDRAVVSGRKRHWSECNSTGRYLEFVFRPNG